MKKDKQMNRMDEAIIQCLLHNKVTVLKDLKEKVSKVKGLEGISESAVQKRVQSMVDPKKGFITKDFLVNKAKAGYGIRYKVCVFVDPSAWKQKKKSNEIHSQESLGNHIRQLAKEEEFRNKILIEEICILFGGKFAMLIDLWAKNIKVVSEFVIEELQMVPGVADTISLGVVWSSKDGWYGTDEKTK